MREQAPPSLTARELLAATLAYVVLTVWWLWPMPAHLATHAAYTLPPRAHPLAEADWYLIVWVLAWGAHALASQPTALFDANAFYPAPRSLAFSEHFLGQQPLFAPVYLATGNAVLAVNVMVLGVFVVSAVAFYAFARRFVSAPAAFVGGVLFSFIPWRSESLLHLHLLGVQYLPLTLLFTERWLERAERRDAWLLAVSLLLQALSSVYLAFALAVLYAPYLLLAAWRWRRRLDRRRVLGLVAAAGGAGAGLALASIPYVEMSRLGLIPSYGAGEYGVSVGVSFAHVAVGQYLLTAGVGPWGYALALLALLPPWGGRRWPIVIALVSCATSLLLASGAYGLRLGGAVLPAPFPWLVSLIPPVAAIRVPSRLVVVAQLGFCLLVALGMQRLAARLRTPAAFAVAALVVAGFLLTWSPPAPALHRVPLCADSADLSAWLRRNGEHRAVLEWPPPDTATDAARQMYLSSCHWLPEVGGYTAYPMRVADLVYDAGRGLPGDGSLQAVVDVVDVGWIVLHEARLDAGSRRAWRAPLPVGLEEAARFGDTRVLRVTRAASPAGLRDRLFSTKQSLGGIPLVPLGPSCPGRIVLASGVPALRLAKTVPVDVLVTNLGDRPWPGAGVIPRHLVHVRACVTPPGGECKGTPEPLGADVPASATRRIRTRVGVPPLVFGPQTLRVELWQLGDGPLERCGTPPLVVDASVH